MAPTWRLLPLLLLTRGAGAGPAERFSNAVGDDTVVLPLLSSASSVAAAAATAAAAASAASPPRAGASVPPARLPPVVVPLSTPPLAVVGLGAPARGVFDPSLAATGDAAAPALLSLSAVEATDDISTVVAAFSAASGAWELLARVNAANRSAALPCAGGAPCAGSVVHEVSSLVLDAGDPDARRRCKLFAHSYIVTNGTELHYDWGRISVWTAPAPGGPWSPEQPLLGWAGASPFSTPGGAQVLTDLPPLRDCLLFTEPGALAVGGDGGGAGAPLLLLALGCASPPAAPGGVAPIRVVLLASADAGRAWAFAATLVDGATDAPALGYAVPQLNAADLFVAPAVLDEPEEDGGAAGGAGGSRARRRLVAPGLAVFVSVTPAATLWPGFVGYAGCLVLQLLPDGSGVVRNATTGAPAVVRAVLPGGVAFSGACAAASGAGAQAGDYLLPALQPSVGTFTVLAAGVAPA